MINNIKIVLYFPMDVWQMFIGYLPGAIGFKLRYRFWKRRLKFLGKNVKIDVGIYFQNPQFISIDDDCWIDRSVIILAGADSTNRKRRIISNNRFPIERGMVYIGKRVHIAPFCIISGIGGVYISDDCSIAASGRVYSFTHHYRSDDEPANRHFSFNVRIDQKWQFMIEGPVFLDKNVGMALNSIILPGVSIGKDSFVSINSIVMLSCEENSLIAGNPAKRIRDRFNPI